MMSLPALSNSNATEFMPSNHNIPSLPREVWETICDDLHPKDLKHTRLVNKLFRTIITGVHCVRPTRFSPELLVRLSDLRWLDLSRLSQCEESGARNFSIISKLHKLEILEFRESPEVTDEVLLQFENLKCLRKLGLSSCPNISYKGFAGLKSLKNLNSLVFPFSGASNDDGVESLLGFTQLKTLAVGGSSLTNRGLVAIAQLSQILALGLIECAHITDDGVKSLSALRHLQFISLSGCQNVSERGQLHLVNHMESTSSAVKFLDISYISASDRLIDRLVKSKILFEVSFSQLSANLKDRFSVQSDIPKRAIILNSSDGVMPSSLGFISFNSLWNKNKHMYNFFKLYPNVVVSDQYMALLVYNTIYSKIMESLKQKTMELERQRRQSRFRKILNFISQIFRRTCNAALDILRFIKNRINP